VVLLPLVDGISTTDIIERIRNGRIFNRRDTRATDAIDATGATGEGEQD